jgi:hypothetical protein
VAGTSQGDKGRGHVASFHSVSSHGVQIGSVHVLIVVPAEAIEGHEEKLVLRTLPVDRCPIPWSEESIQSYSEEDEEDGPVSHDGLSDRQVHRLAHARKRTKSQGEL